VVGLSLEEAAVVARVDGQGLRVLLEQGLLVWAVVAMGLQVELQVELQVVVVYLRQAFLVWYVQAVVKRVVVVKPSAVRLRAQLCL
jgi:hypothetical protein